MVLPMGSGAAQGATAAGNASTATAPQRLKSQVTNADTGQTARSFGKFNTNDIAFLLQAAAGSPESAATILRLALGQTGRPLGRFASAWDDLHGGAFQTSLALAGADGFGNLESMADDYLSNALQGNDLLGYAGGLANKIGGMDFSGMETADMDKFLKAQLALNGLNMGGLGQSQQSGRLDDLIWQDIVRNFADPGTNKNFADLLANSPYQRAMQAFGR